MAVCMRMTDTGAKTPSAACPEYGIDRSNMGTQWMLGAPYEPNVSPFLSSEYNQPGNFEARRITVFDGIARQDAQPRSSRSDYRCRRRRG
jgi:hypothetical protein